MFKLVYSLTKKGNRDFDCTCSDFTDSQYRRIHLEFCYNAILSDMEVGQKFNVYASKNGRLKASVV
jgi:hypothetical protein